MLSLLTSFLKKQKPEEAPKQSSRSAAWAQLKDDYELRLKGIHLRQLLSDASRNNALLFRHDDILLDLSHEKLDEKSLQLLEQLASKLNLQQRITQMFEGQPINTTEKRAVLHTALRAPRTQQLIVDGKNVIADVWQVLDRIRDFSKQVREGTVVGYSGKALTNVIVIGIGGSYLSIEFVHEALRSLQQAQTAASGRKIRFLANVDPIDFTRAVEGIDPETTLVVINSKTFTTAETILNAKTVKNWILAHYEKKQGKALTPEQSNSVSNAHLAAVSTNIPATTKFGIQASRVFGFWDWVGGRFSVWSAIGVLPLSLQYGFELVELFLRGAHEIDVSFRQSNSLRENLPLLLGLVGFYNTTIGGHTARAILPYCQALCKFVPHVQQLDMESNGKRVSLQGNTLDYQCTVVNFGEPGTNGQHSFYQLLHQGRTVPCEFIGFVKSQAPTKLSDEKISNHEELMSNFFSQPDALAYGKTIEELRAERVDPELLAAKLFPGDRPSLSLLFKELNAFTCGQLLALYEHRTSVEGFIWDINSYDQMGVELGKVLAKNVREYFITANESGQVSETPRFNSATRILLEHFVKNK